MTRNRRTKSVEQSILDTDEPGTRLRKDLTWWDLTVFGIWMVVGFVIYFVYGRRHSVLGRRQAATTSAFTKQWFLSRQTTKCGL